MNDENVDHSGSVPGGWDREPAEPPRTEVEEVPPEAEPEPPGLSPRRVRLPLFLFVATCASAFLAGGRFTVINGWFLLDYADGFLYALLLMTILVCHEAGHFLQARRYGVYASLPYFLPMPLSPIGTFGAVIAMDARVRDRKALFDIGISGPLAGLAPTLICCVVGVLQARIAIVIPSPFTHQYGDPLLLKLLYRWRFGPLPPGVDVILNPVLWAGWVGLLITAINLLPIGQLDGGHVLYALVRKRAHGVASLLLFSAAVAVIVFGYYWWLLMLGLLLLMGPQHPPTGRDDVPLGAWRIVLGWLALAFVFFSFTPNPFKL